VFNRLYLFDIYERRFHVELIDSWRADRSGHKFSYIFYLRSDMKFHHGDPVELEDVKRSYDLFLDLFPFYKKYIDRVNIAEEENGVELELSRWLKLEYLPAPYIIPRGCAEDDECFEGTGPFRLIALEQQNRMREGLKQPVTLESNNAYFGKIPVIQTIEFRRYDDAGELRDNLERREVDMAYDLDLEDSERFNVNYGHGSLSFYLILNQDSEVCQDESLRRAVDFAIDRQRIAEIIGLRRTQFLPNLHLHLILRGKPDGENNYDQAKAKECWKEALASLSKRGITEPMIRIGGSIHDAEVSAIINEIIRHLKEVGIDAEEEYDTGKADALVAAAGFKEPRLVYLILHSSQRSERLWGYSNVYVDHLLDNIKGMETYQQIQDILTAERFFLPLIRRRVAVTYTKDLDTKGRLRTHALYGPDIVHWEFK
jgi:ABC-type transport system substrate-binding protein